ncbi:hypothetical protein [Rhodococcus sp. IEGM 1307]|uniref:hypothetical protein n=1 Tax=Rhodococcus sp. IEGM 1307 TaxID=3047091 RepID=UPI0024B75407|nr:hypothetical protein [Rhodococcus sp. IEGM 1307]MDI9975680.1 hypothetical protein [Rhodococcus sp. IEGM 1307]
MIDTALLLGAAVAAAAILGVLPGAVLVAAVPASWLALVVGVRFAGSIRGARGEIA